MGPTEPNFWHIKIMIVVLISHINIFFSTCFSSILILLGYNKIEKSKPLKNMTLLNYEILILL